MIKISSGSLKFLSPFNSKRSFFWEYSIYRNEHDEKPEASKYVGMEFWDWFSVKEFQTLVAKKFWNSFTENIEFPIKSPIFDINSGDLDSNDRISAKKCVYDHVKRQY